MYALLNRYKRKQAFFTEKKACFSLYLFGVIISLQVSLLLSLEEQSVP
jgi:hypothetical protein